MRVQNQLPLERSFDHHAFEHLQTGEHKKAYAGRLRSALTGRPGRLLQLDAVEDTWGNSVSAAAG